MPAEPIKPDGVRCNPAPARFWLGERLVLDLNGLGPPDCGDHRPECFCRDTTHRGRGGVIGWELAHPGVCGIQDAIGDGPKLGQIATGVGLQEKRIKGGAPNVSAGALVVDHVLWGHADIAIQVGGRLVHRNAEHIRQIAPIHMPLPKQPELDEFEPPFDTPSKFRFIWRHREIPCLTHSVTMYAQLLGPCRSLAEKRDVLNRK